jgi:hypothetical protein
MDGAQVVEGNATLLYAQALDVKDGSLDPVAFNWSSDRDGVLGTGDQLIAQNLSLGVHILTVDVVNTAGLHTLQSVRIEVVPAGAIYIETLPGTGSLRIIFMAGLCIVTFSIAIFLSVLVRRKKWA